MTNLDLERIPFSVAGSFLKVVKADTGRLMIADARAHPRLKVGARQWTQDFVQLAIFATSGKRSREIPYAWEASPWEVRLLFEGGEGRLAFVDEETVGISVRGAFFKLLPCKSVSVAHRFDANHFSLHDFHAHCRQIFRAGRGTRLETRQSRTVHGESGPWHDRPYTVSFVGKDGAEGAFRVSRQCEVWLDSPPAIAKGAARTRSAYRAFAAKRPPAPKRFEEPATFAWYLLWQLQVPAEGRLTRPALYMSKRWMNKVWGWDNCFNALALAKADLGLALDQLRLFFDAQDPSGAFADSITNLDVQYAYAKPPVFGWTVEKLLAKTGKKALLPFFGEAYEPLCRNTEWWFAYRDHNGNGFPVYLHGIDSGWDNASVFDAGLPLEGADLAAFLVKQMEVLSEMAAALGKRGEAARWAERSQALLDKLLARRVKGNRFFSAQEGKERAKPVNCLLNRVPLILGKRLPEPVRCCCAKDLRPSGPFLTDYGPATQPPTSNLYQEDGYWRGPIWAPAVYEIVDGLIACEREKLAAEIADRFCRACARDGYMWENYNALTGEGNRCPGYSWTAAVFVLLCEWLAGREAATHADGP